MRKIFALPLLALEIFGITMGTIACNSQKKEETPNYTPDTYNFKKYYSNTGSFTFDRYLENTPALCRIVTYKINKSIGKSTFFKIELETDCNLVGWIAYCDSNNKEKTNVEKFFIEEGDKEFCSFFDSFRSGAFGAFENKDILSIAFQSVDSTKEGKFTFKSFSAVEREYSHEKMYIDDGTLKFGTSVNYGGCIEWVERIDINVIEYIDSGGNVRIDKDIDPSMVSSNRLISSNVNMVNTYDLGREIQPSYYLKVNKENNGYNPLTEYKYESITGTFSYNPIQCGGVGDIEKGIVTEPQIIDYVYKQDHIYFKTKGQDWMFVNDQAQGYIEANYHFGDDGLLIVDNSYIDFYQFTNLNSVNNPMSGQETPATYFVYPLNYFYCETKSRTINDPYVGPQGYGNSVVEDPASTAPSPGTYFYGFKANNMKNNCDWIANVNDQKFGAGIFMPNADYYIDSRGQPSCAYSDRQNCTYSKRFYDFGDKLTPSYAASNYNYMNPQLRRRMIEFVALEYQYAIYVGDVSEMREAFANAKEQGLTNDNLTLSENTWPKK